jgi:hypothetical protein
VLCLGRDGYSIGPPTTVLTDSALHAMYGSAVGLHLHDH